MTADDKHIPVLANETLDLLMAPFDGKFCRIVDGTLGFGGHSSRILERNPQARLLGIDRDRVALNASAERLRFAGDRVTLRHGRFSDIRTHVQSAGWDKVDGILLDIGVSSVQLDTPERGFSYRFDGPLDMRMNPESGMTAADLLNQLPEDELSRIFRDYGEIRQARQLAREIVRIRTKDPFDSCGKFAAVCDRVLKQRGGPPAPTLPFQALRIAVNEELKELEEALSAAMDLLAVGGRLCVITFHSLEDRIVKHFFQDMAETCKCPPGCPVCVCNWDAKLQIVTKKPVTATEEELARNSRSSCAKLRAAERIEKDNQQHKTEGEKAR
ncbi:MAG: 16S rRNA (cytosine(1402)-N(4))-methyltransferase RsmH [Lentisphaeria bacterium]|nr:16S rRNA (cytosine(1402)-N(4))-methyltransferase RsmH [Lentisphaeria bacterium]